MRRRALHTSLLLLSIATLAHTVIEAANSIRGVGPDAAAEYNAAINMGSFQCLDGSRIIAATAINDNYCDCEDGSDEPGSSACAGGSFHCRNRGHKSKNLSSTFVDDGICDCCDGTDEAAGTCNSNCLAEGAAAREELQAAAKAATAGSKVRAQRVKAAKAERRSIQSKLQSLKAQIAEARPEVDKLAAKKEAAEKVAEKLREQHDAAEAAAKKSQVVPEEAPEPVAEAASATPQAAQVASEVDDKDDALQGATTKEVPSDDGSSSEAVPQAAQEAEAAQSEADGQQAAAVASEGAAAKQEAVTQTDEERAKETMAQWVKDDPPAASGVSEDAAAPNAEKEEDPDEEDPDSFPEDDEDLAAEAEIDAADRAEAESTKAAVGSKVASAFQRTVQWAAALLKKTPRLVAPSELERFEKAASGASTKHRERNDELQELVRKETEYQTKGTQDYGPEDVFLPLHGKCYTTTVDKYVYEACPFGKAAQKEGGSSTSLGTFKRFEGNFTSMIFEDGQNCWQGPNRSLKLALTCGTAEVLSGVSEPSRCVYAANMVTPSLCTPEALQRLQAEVEKANAEVDGAKHDEL